MKRLTGPLIVFFAGLGALLVVPDALGQSGQGLKDPRIKVTIKEKEVVSREDLTKKEASDAVRKATGTQGGSYSVRRKDDLVAGGNVPIPKRILDIWARNPAFIREFLQPTVLRGTSASGQTWFTVLTPVIFALNTLNRTFALMTQYTVTRDPEPRKPERSEERTSERSEERTFVPPANNTPPPAPILPPPPPQDGGETING